MYQYTWLYLFEKNEYNIQLFYTKMTLKFSDCGRYAVHSDNSKIFITEKGLFDLKSIVTIQKWWRSLYFKRYVRDTYEQIIVERYPSNLNRYPSFYMM